jgi:hypothetical protein
VILQISAFWVARVTGYWWATGTRLLDEML